MINLKSRGKGPVGPLGYNTVVGIFLVALAVFIVGAICVWPRLFGDPARMTVTNCILNTGKASQCSGKVLPNGETTFILYADSKDLGHDVDVHIIGDFASMDTAWTFVLPALGVLGCAGGVYAARIRRQDLQRLQRRRQRQTPRTPGTEWLPPQ